MQHTSFVQHFFSVVVVTWNFLITRFMEKMLYVLTKNFVPCIPFFFFFFQCRSFFTLLTARISYFLTAATKCSCCPCYEIRLLCFLSLDLALCCSLCRWVSLACRLLSRFLCLSLSLYSKSEDMTINLSLILETTRI